MDKLVPGSLLLAPGISASAKLIWLLLRLQIGGAPVDPTLLGSQSRLSRKTVVKALAELADVVVRRSGAPAIHPPRGQFTYTQLSALTGICRPTLRQAIRELVDTGWVEASTAAPPPAF